MFRTVHANLSSNNMKVHFIVMMFRTENECRMYFHIKSRGVNWFENTRFIYCYLDIFHGDKFSFEIKYKSNFKCLPIWFSFLQNEAKQ